MIKNRKILENFNRTYLKQKRDSYSQRLKIYEALLKEAIYFKKLPLKNPLENIEGCLRLARILNASKK